MPVIGLALGGINFTEQTLSIGAVVINWGAFLQAIIDFLIIAFVVFLIIKAANLRKQEEEAPAEPTTKECPFCYTDIPIKATRCPHCTSQLK
jgi:large conductance mechanosensitive channel